MQTNVGTFASYTYAGDRLESVETSGSPEPERYRYDQAGRLVRIEDPRSGATEFAYDARSRVTTRRSADGTQETWQYDDSALTVRHVDERGGVTIRQTSADGRRESVTDPTGQTTLVDLDGEARPVRITGPTGKAVVLTYDALGRLVRTADAQTSSSTALTYLGQTSLPVSITKPDGSREELEYDTQRNLVRVKENGEVVLSIAYLANGLVERVSERGGRERRFAYDAAGRTSTVTDSLGRVTRYEYDARGNPARVIDPAGGVRLRIYDGHDRLVAETDPMGGVTRFEYDRAGRLVRTVDPTGSATRFEYDASGTRVSLVDGANRRAEMHITPRQLTLRRADGRTEESRLDAAGRLQEITHTSGRTSRFQHDRLGRIVSETSATGRVVKYSYDDSSRPTGVETGLGGRLMYLWDASDRPVAVVDPTGATQRFRYDPKGRVTAVVDPLGRETRLSHDAGGRLAAVTTPAGETAQYGYDSEGRLLTSRDTAGRVTRFEYDGLDNVALITGPDGAGIRQSYDRAGRRTSATDAAGRTTRFAYDGAGRLAAKTLPDGRAVRYQHGPTGNLLAIDDGVYPLRYGYDAAGRIVEVAHAALRRSVRYGYDAMGRPASVAGTSGQEVRYRYDGSGRLVAIALPQGGEIGLAFDAGDRLQTIRYPNGVVGEWSYDPAGRIERIVYRLPGPPTAVPTARESSLQYRYDAAGDIIEQRGPDPTATRQYRYDVNGRLLEEQAGGKATGYTYRPGGDRVERRDGAAAVAYQYDQAGRIVSAGSERFAHDGIGSLTRRDSPQGVTQYQFDVEARLVAATTPRGGLAFGYAPSGDRVWRRGPDGVLVRYVHDGANVLEELAEDGTLRAFYVHGPRPDRPLAMIRDGQAVFYHADALGTIRFLTDAAGRIVATYEVDAFGSLRSGLPADRIPASNPFIFTGREYDPDLGLYYFRARYYDPELGRFLSPDPLLGALDTPETLNRYAYALNAPTRYVDPLGLNGHFTIERLIEHYQRLGDANGLESLYKARPDLRPQPLPAAAPAAASITPAAPVAPPASSALPGVTPPQAAPPPVSTAVGAAVAAEAGATSAATTTWGSRAWDFMTKPRGPNWLSQPLSSYLEPAPPSVPGAAVRTDPWTWKELAKKTLTDPKAQSGIVGDALKGAGIGAVAGVATAIGEVLVNPTNPSAWANVGLSGLKGAGGGLVSSVIWQAIKEAGTKAGAKGMVELVEKTLGRAGPWAAIAAAAAPQLIENWRLRNAYKELDAAKQAQATSPGLTPTNVNTRLAQLRQDLAAVRQLHSNLGALAPGGADPLANARAKVAELERLATPDPAETQRSCMGLEGLVKKLKSTATNVSTHFRAATRIFDDPGERPLQKAALETALSQLKLGAQAASAARTDWEQASGAIKSLAQSGPRAGDSLQAEAMKLIGSAQTGTPQSGGAGTLTDNLNAFKGRKNSLLVHTRGMMAAVDGHRMVGAAWADFRDIELQAESLKEPKVGDASSRVAGDAADLQVRANAALTTIKARPANPCEGYGASPTDLQTQWDAIKQSSQSMVTAYDARVNKIKNFVQHAERTIREGTRQVEAARAAGDGARQREAERLVQQARDLKMEGERETVRLKEVEATVADLRKIATATR